MVDGMSFQGPEFKSSDLIFISKRCNNLGYIVDPVTILAPLVARVVYHRMVGRSSLVSGIFFQWGFSYLYCINSTQICPGTVMAQLVWSIECLARVQRSNPEMYFFFIQT